MALRVIRDVDRIDPRPTDRSPSGRDRRRPVTAFPPADRTRYDVPDTMHPTASPNASRVALVPDLPGRQNRRDDRHNSFTAQSLSRGRRRCSAGRDVMGRGAIKKRQNTSQTSVRGLGVLCITDVVGVVRPPTELRNPSGTLCSVKRSAKTRQPRFRHLFPQVSFGKVRTVSRRPSSAGGRSFHGTCRIWGVVRIATGAVTLGGTRDAM